MVPGRYRGHVKRVRSPQERVHLSFCWCLYTETATLNIRIPFLCRNQNLRQKAKKPVSTKTKNNGKNMSSRQKPHALLYVHLLTVSFAPTILVVFGRKTTILKLTREVARRKERRMTLLDCGNLLALHT